MNYKNISILYVEDEDNVREMLKSFIGRFCEDIYIAKDGKEGLASYKQHKVDIVISDIKMPKMNGIEMVEAIKKINPQQIVIFTTAHIDSEYLFRAIELQVGAYVPKPIDLDVLKSNIDKACHEIEAKEAIVKLKESEEKFRTITQTAQMGIFIYKEQFVYANDVFCKALGYTREEILEVAPWKILKKEYQEMFKSIAFRRLKGEKFPTEYSDLEIHTKSKGMIIARVSVDTIEYEGSFAGFGTLVDITDVVSIKERLKLLAQAMEQMDEMVRITDADGVINYVNDSLTKHTGYKKSELLGKTNRIFKSSQHTQDFYQKLWDTILAKKPYQAVFVNKKKNGELYYDEQTITPILDENNDITHYVSTGRDITERINLEKQMQKLATVDTLTNICNRYQTNKLIEEEISRSKRFKTPFALVMFDIDFFKRVNDTYGHDVGDSVLQEFSQIIKENIRETDKFGRWGGEEFMLILERVTPESTLKFANKLRVLVEEYNFSDVGKITVSAGAVLYNEVDSKESLLKRGDEALYDAKAGGRNRVVFR